ILHDLYGLWYGNPIVGRGTIYTKEAKTIELFLSSPQIKPESLSYFYPDLEAYKLHGNIIFDALIRGDISEPVTAINVEVPSITTKEYTLENFNFYGYLQGKNLCIKNLKGSIKGYPYEKNHLSFEGNMFLSKNSNGFLGSIAITSEGGIWKGVSLGSIDSYGYMLKDKLFIDHFNVLDIGEKGNLYTMGYISNREISLNYWTDDLPLELFNKLENIPYKLYGNVMVNGMIKGSPAEPQIDGHIAIKTARAGDLKFSLSSEFYMDKKKLSFSDFSLLRENGMYNMDGEIKLQKPWNITLNIGIEGGRISQWKELSALLSEMKIDGKIKAAISLEGKLEDLLKSTSFNDMDLNNMDIKGEVSIFNSKIKDANIDVITTEFALEEGIINLSNCTAAHKNSSLQAKGTYNMKNKELSLNFVSPRFYFEDFKEILKGNILKGRGQLRGSFLGTKEDFKGWSEFQLLSPEYKGHMVDWSTGNLEFNKNDVTIKSLHIKKNNDLYQISGNMSLKEDPELFLILNAYNVKIENFLEVADIKKLPPIKGKFSTQAHLRGTLHEPVLSVVIKTNNISINTFPIENLTAEFNLTGKEIHIGTLEVNSEKMRLTGYGHIDMDKDTNLTLEGKNISLDLIEKSLMLHEKLNLEGKLDLNLQATGPTDKINLIGSFQVRDAMFNNYSISRIRSLISYDGSILQIKSLDFVEKDFNLFAKGDIPLEFNDNRWICPGPMDIGITTSANDLSVINAFNSDFEGTHGEIKSDLHIGGTLFEPQLNGEISVKDGIIIHKVSKEPLKNFNMSLSIDNRSITLKNLEGNLGEGIVNAKGVLHLENFRPEEIALSLSGERLLLDLPDYLKSEVSFKSSLKGKCQEPLFSGDIILNNYSVELYPGIFSSSFTPTSASSKIDDLFQTIQPEFKLEEQEKTVISKTDFSDMIKLNFNIKIGDDYWIKSNIFQMRLKGDVKLGGTISSPTLEGDINIPTGSLSLLGTKFDIKDSSLSFEKENGILPVLSLRASTYLQGYAILVDSYGLLPDKVTTTYRSDPPTSRDDLNRLLSPGSDTIGKQDVFKDAILNFATSTVTPFVFNPLEDTFRKGFGLDIFNIQLSPTGGLGLEIGKEFTDWFRLTYRIYNQDEMTVLNSRRYYVEREVLNLQFKIKEHSNFNIGTNTAGDFTSHVEVNYRF
ncbi:MAG TPA: translocation/assembly module TamB domain-containing protein, partial [Candidatus Eremiobacteraeota bacterium]|nr:translocation/assembly module TamB domain-containing protein [Candidatus Eremiobacteraeota bacterium]